MKTSILNTSAVLLLALLSAANAQEEAVTSTTAATAQQTEDTPKPEPESAWGRIYLRNGLAPIQYFRDNFGGPMVNREVSFYFPKRDEDRLGCKLLPEEEQTELQATARSVVLVVDRGECTFEQKSRLADQMGAAGLVVVSPTDDVSGPVGDPNTEDEITIPSVMIRRTGGNLLRAVAAETTVHGRLIPMTCQRSPYMCKPRLEAEHEYIASFTVRSGSVLSSGGGEKDDSDARLGSFLAATYGSVLRSMRPFPLTTLLDGHGACLNTVTNGADEPQFLGKVVLLPEGKADQCSEFEKVSNAQRRGASVVLLVQRDNATVMTHPTVDVSWHAYNITIPVLAVSSSTCASLVNLKDTQGDTASVRFEVRNGVAEAWDLLVKYSQRSAWPKRQTRCSRLLGNLLTQIRGIGADAETEVALKNVFLTVVGGTLQEWKEIANPGDAETREEPVGKTHETITHTVQKTQGRDEL
ncbi:hypothetical protein PHYBOEH_010931 [Phytophthora boehmeriae]|uniref:PA domain-containing protein n=1 Tax=Phytophthora boehmeriae TaxID=109152 RepID=A0A8T1VMQ8_9STRA|nr:hypothetical protein PHYBOEH_010931 [Phytophthora boehmeriae]